MYSWIKEIGFSNLCQSTLCRAQSTSHKYLGGKLWWTFSACIQYPMEQKGKALPSPPVSPRSSGILDMKPCESNVHSELHSRLPLLSVYALGCANLDVLCISCDCTSWPRQGRICFIVCYLGYWTTSGD